MPSPPDETSLAETGLQSGSGAAASHPSAGSASRPGWLSSSPAAGREALTPGTLLAERYRILGLVGRGGMGEVYRAEDLRLGQSVALKFLPAAVAEDPQRLAQFHHEVRIARQVSHRNVCRVYDIGEDHGRVFLTMELVDGEDLAAAAEARSAASPRSAPPRSRARSAPAWPRRTSSACCTATSSRPTSCSTPTAASASPTSAWPGWPAASPTSGPARRPTWRRSSSPARRSRERSDIFALGLVLFEIFTGKRAFDATTIAELLRQHDDGVRLSPAAPGARSIRSSSRSSCAASRRIPRSGRPARWRCRRRCPAAIRWPRRWPPARRRRRRWSPLPAGSSRCRSRIGLPLLAFVVVCFGGAGRVAAGDGVLPLHAGRPAAGGARGPRAPGPRSLRLPRALQPTASSQLRDDGDYLRWARRQPAATRWDPAGDGTRAGGRPLVPHQPALPRADARMDAGVADRSAVPDGRHDLRRRRRQRRAPRLHRRAAAADAGGGAVGRRDGLAAGVRRRALAAGALHAGDAGVDAAGRDRRRAPPGPARVPELGATPLRLEAGGVRRQGGVRPDRRPVDASPAACRRRSRAASSARSTRSRTCSCCS